MPIPGIGPNISVPVGTQSINQPSPVLENSVLPEITAKAPLNGALPEGVGSKLNIISE